MTWKIWEELVQTATRTTLKPRDHARVSIDKAQKSLATCKAVSMERSAEHLAVAGLGHLAYDSQLRAARVVWRIAHRFMAQQH